MNDGYNGMSLNLRVGGDFAASALASIDTPGGHDGESTGAVGGNAGDVYISIAGDISIAATPVINAYGGDGYTNQVGGDGGTITIHYAGTLTGAFGAFDVSGGTAVNGTSGADGTANPPANTLGAGHMPGRPMPVTPDGAATSALEFSIPADINGNVLGFSIELEKKLNDAVFLPAVVQDSNTNASQFSGVPPYDQGSGSVTYTLPGDGLIPGQAYRWRVTALKDGNGLAGIPSPWREFIAV